MIKLIENSIITILLSDRVEKLLWIIVFLTIKNKNTQYIHHKKKYVTRRLTIKEAIALAELSVRCNTITWG
uniref:Uncharacterized protein n=1 Tax=viral metagenome TaxID=1070528 RepID=A0A6M3LV21_9ZZZZ